MFCLLTGKECAMDDCALWHPAEFGSCAGCSVDAALSALVAIAKAMERRD